MAIKNDLKVYKLPFNLILKCRSRVYEQEAIVMAAFETIGTSVAKLIMYGHDGECTYSDDTNLSEDELRTIGQELKTCRPHGII